MKFGKLENPKKRIHSTKYEVRLNGILMAVSPSEMAARHTAEFMPGAVVMKKQRGGTLVQTVRGE